MLTNNKKTLKGYIFIFITMLLLIVPGAITGCGGGSGDSGGTTGNEQTDLNSGGLLPDGVKATVDGDSYNCYMSYDSSCTNYTCAMNCYNDYLTALSALDPGDPNYDADAEALYAAYELCDNACFSGCDMTSSFVISITLTNTTTQTVTVTLPAGLTFLPSDSGYQPMMIIKEITITLTSEETVSMCLPVYCLALSLHAPDEEAVFTDYNIVNPSDTGCLPYIIGILTDVDFSKLTYSDYNAIQDIVWSCTEYGSIDTDEDAFLNSLPTLIKEISNTKSPKTGKKCPACKLKKLNFI